MRWKHRGRIQLRRIVIRIRHRTGRAPWNREPSLLTVVSGHAFARGHVHDRNPEVRRLGINLDWQPTTSSQKNVPFFHARQDLVECGFSSERIDILSQQCIPRWPTAACRLVIMITLYGQRLARLAKNRWNLFRSNRSAVARVAGYFSPSREIVLVDCLHHTHHLARRLFSLLVVLVLLALDVAELALHAQ